jgi:FG-GAP repeat protein
MKTTAVLRSGLIIAMLISLIAPTQVISIHAQSGGSIQLAVDTADFTQDGLLVLFGSLRSQGEVGLPVGAGDINGDGRADVIFCGMFGSSNSRTNNGVVNFYISDGRDSGFVNSGDNPPNIFRLHGQSSGDLLGTSVSANGDINGDGIRDVAIGASAWDRTGSISDNAGAAYVVLGSPNFNADLDLGTANGDPPPGVIAIRGPQTGGRMGIWIDEGDVDGDGLADIVIGSDQINSAAGQHVGGAYIVFGSPSLPSVIDLAAPPAGVRTARIIGQRQEEHWGAALQVGDVNNDGKGDVIIGGSIFRDSASYVSPTQDNGHDARGAGFGGQRPGCGEVYVIYGQQNWPATTDLSAPPQNATHVIGAHATDLLGSQVHSGDVNGDGKTDLVLGALQAVAPDNKGSTGAAYIIYGSPAIAGTTIDLLSPDQSGLHVTTIYGEHHLDCAGDSVRTYDINNDGFSDLFIGSPERTFSVGGELREDTGVTEVIYGQSDFLPPVIKLYDPPASPTIFRLAGAREEDEFSYRLAGGDVDGDGYIDYIANAMHGDGFGNGVTNGGNVYIFSGKKLSARLNMLPVDPNPTPAPQIASATLSVNGQTVQQANAGQSGLRIIINGSNLREDTQVTINGSVVASHLEGSPARIRIELDENPAIKNTVGQLIAQARNTTPPPSNLSNEAVAGRLVGPEIASVTIKKKSSGMLVVKIRGSNFPLDGTVEARAGGQLVKLKSTSVDEVEFIDTKIKAKDAPASGAALHVIVRAQSGIQSNEMIAVVP